mmetsp:Transcript_75801/g.220118  ORF Transcript_75801/g.220118 Transcript_75801/m.220118 type:complete len:184 (-) Transcript_75801:230-781(-)
MVVRHLADFADPDSLLEAIGEIRRWKRLFKKYDNCHVGVLGKDQVRKAMTDANCGKEPSSIELACIMKFYGDGTHSLGLVEFKEAMECWSSYLRQEDDLRATIAHFNRSGTGKLDRWELRDYLVHLSRGAVVSSAEVDWVLSGSSILGDGICYPLELMRATSLWHASRAVRRPRQSSCGCIIS